MSEYQYYEFLAVDRALTEADRRSLREVSTRARITATSFVNTYEWGDFRGDPVKLVARWFDLHLYLANWGSRRLMMRWPERLLDMGALPSFPAEMDWVQRHDGGGHVILDVVGEEIEGDGWDDGSGWMAALAPLRGDVLAGDLRVFHLVWLMGVQAEVIEADATEPIPGIGPLTGALEAFAAFFDIDADLVAAAAERGSSPAGDDAAEVRAVIAGLDEATKAGLLLRVAEGDAGVAAELRARERRRRTTPPPAQARRTARELLERAGEVRHERMLRERAAGEAEARERVEAEERTRRARIEQVKQLGEAAWHQVETEIAQANGAAYGRAAVLLADLASIAAEAGAMDAFSRRLGDIRARYGRKHGFLRRIEGLGGGW